MFQEGQQKTPLRREFRDSLCFQFFLVTKRANLPAGRLGKTQRAQSRLLQVVASEKSVAYWETIQHLLIRRPMDPYVVQKAQIKITPWLNKILYLLPATYSQ